MGVSAGVAAGHPATAEVGLRMLAAGGNAADAAVAAVLASCVAESVLTGITGGGYATYYDAVTRTVTCLDFFVAVPGLDGDREPVAMEPIVVDFGGAPLEYSIGAASVAVPGVPAGCGELHSRWGRLPWHRVVAPAVDLATLGTAIPAAQARTLPALAAAMLAGDGAGIYAPGGRILEGGDLLFHPGLDQALRLLAEDGPDVFYTGAIGERMVEVVRATGGALGPADLASYHVLELPVARAAFAGAHVYGRTDLNRTVPTIGTIGDVTQLAADARAVVVADALRDLARARLGDTTNVSVVDHDGNACVVTTTLGLGAGVWLPGLGVHLNSMLGEGELYTSDLKPGHRMSSMMCPLVVTREAARPAVTTDGLGATQVTEPDRGVATADQLGDLPAAERADLAAAEQLAALSPLDGLGGRRRDTGANVMLAVGAAGASRIRTALVHTLIGVLVDGLAPQDAIDRPRFHITERTAHVEPGVDEVEVSALARAGYQIQRWERLNHYFGGASAVGRAGAGGDPRRGGVGLVL